MNNSVSILKGIDFIEEHTKRLMIANNLDYKEGMTIANLNYDINVKIDTHKVHKATIIHDGTLLFFWNELDKMFWHFATSSLLPLEYKNCVKPPMVNYTIGDIIIENEYDVETDKPFPMMKQTIMIPYKMKVMKREDTVYE